MTQEAVARKVQDAQVQPTQSIQSLIEQSAKELGKALPEHMRPERLVRIALTNIRLNPKLSECTPASFLGALFTAAQLGIEPVGGRAYLLPFNNRRKVGNEWKSFKEVQFIMGYKGVAELFYRHEKSVMLSWSAVKEGDDFGYEYGTNEFLRHVPAKTKRGKTVGYWALAKLAGGGSPFLYMSIEECMDHAKRHSKSFDKKEEKFDDNSPWITEPDSMCLKTVFIQLAKTLPLSVEVQRALGADESSREYRREIDSALDLPDTTNWNQEPAETVEPVEVEKKTESAKPKVNGNGDAAFQASILALREKLTNEEFDGVLQVFGVKEIVELSTDKRNAFLIQLGKRVAMKEDKPR